MPSGCILLDTFVVAPDDAAIVYGRADTGESRVAGLHAWIGSSLHEDGAWIPNAPQSVEHHGHEVQ